MEPIKPYKYSRDVNQSEVAVRGSHQFLAFRKVYPSCRERQTLICDVNGNGHPESRLFCLCAPRDSWQHIPVSFLRSTDGNVWLMAGSWSYISPVIFTCPLHGTRCHATCYCLHTPCPRVIHFSLCLELFCPISLLNFGSPPVAAGVLLTSLTASAGLFINVLLIFMRHFLPAFICHTC